MFFKKKIFAYECSDGDKGIIVAMSYKKAEQIFYKKYPERQITDNDHDYWNNGAYLFECDEIKNGKLYCCFPW